MPVILIISSTVTETRMKSAVKTKAKKTNNQAMFGGSLLQNNMEVEVVMVCSKFASFMYK